MRIHNMLLQTKCQLIEQYECEHKAELRNNIKLKEYVESRTLWGQAKVTAGQILDAVQQGQLFGMVECDIQVRLHVYN